MFNPHAVETNQNGAFTVTLAVENAANAQTAPITVHYDPKFLRLNDATAGDLLSRDGKQPIFTKNIQNDAGNANILLNRPAGSLGISGSGNLVTLSFQAIGKGTTTVEVQNLVLRNPDGQPSSGTSALLPVNIR
jgi:general secretion pathway protein D